MILDVAIRRPDGANHDRDTLCTISTLNSQPEHSQDRPRDDTEISEVVSKGSPNGDREGDV
jgi:hypothetical protein